MNVGRSRLPSTIRWVAAALIGVAVLGGCGSSSKKAGAGHSKGAEAPTTSAGSRRSGSGPAGGAGGGSSGGQNGSGQGGGTDGAAGSALPGTGSGPGVGTKVSTQGLPTGATLQKLVSVARQSVTDVPMLHDFAVGLGRAGGLPNSLVAAQAMQIQQRFAAGAKTASTMSGDASSVLDTALNRYATLAGELHTAALASKPLPNNFTSDLEAADASWKSAVQAIGKAGDTDLLAMLPPLLMPNSSTSTTVPPPPK